MTDVKQASLRAYNVGFGDCMLLRLTYTDDTERNVLIDFGSSQLPRGAPATRMADIAADIKTITHGHLDMVVATHRHSDHISGFGRADTGDIIEALEPEVVVQPWTEDPHLKPDARQPIADDRPAAHLALARTLTDMDSFARGAR